MGPRTCAISFGVSCPGPRPSGGIGTAEPGPVPSTAGAGLAEAEAQAFPGATDVLSSSPLSILVPTEVRKDSRAGTPYRHLVHIDLTSCRLPNEAVGYQCHLSSHRAALGSEFLVSEATPGLFSSSPHTGVTGPPGHCARGSEYGVDAAAGGCRRGGPPWRAGASPGSGFSGPLWERGSQGEAPRGPTGTGRL